MEGVLYKVALYRHMAASCLLYFVKKISFLDDDDHGEVSLVLRACEG